MVETLTKVIIRTTLFFSNQEKQAIENRLLELNYLMINDEKQRNREESKSI